MTSIVYDFDAIRSRMPGAELTEETSQHPTALATLIAEEREHAWRAENPPRGDEMPEGIADLYGRAHALEETASTLTSHAVAWVPDNLADAIRLLEYGRDLCRHPGCVVPRVLAGLRIINASADNAAAQSGVGAA